MYIWSWKIFLSAFIPRLSPTPVSVWTLLFLHFIVNKKSVKMCRLHKRIVMTWQTAIIIGSGVVAVRCSVAHTSCGGDTPPYHCVCVHLLSNSSWWSPWLLHLFSCFMFHHTMCRMCAVLPAQAPVSTFMFNWWSEEVLGKQAAGRDGGVNRHRVSLKHVVEVSSATVGSYTLNYWWIYFEK